MYQLCFCYYLNLHSFAVKDLVVLLLLASLFPIFNVKFILDCQAAITFILCLNFREFLSFLHVFHEPRRGSYHLL
jgi:hypothetical protein